MDVPAPTSTDGKWAMRLVEFNLHVARYAHRSWYSSALGDLLFDVHGHLDARAEPQVSDWLLRESSLHRDMDWQMDEPQKRLWLLDEPSLDRLTFELAIAMHRDWFVRVVDGGRVRLLQSKVGQQLWRFVVEEVPAGLLHHRSPVVDFENSAPEQLEVALKEDGARTLMALLPPEWRAVRGRAQLCFNAALARNRVPSFTAARSDSALKLICTHLIFGRMPQWAWLF